MRCKRLIITMLVIAAAVFIAVPVTADTGVPAPDTDNAILALILAAGIGLSVGLIERYQTLSDRAIIGQFFNRLAVLTGASWIDKISMYFQSDQAIETYPWLGMVPAMREWIGGRNAKGLREYGLTVANKDFEATLEILTKDKRRDKSGQVMVRVNELAQRTVTHWASLLSTLIVNGETGQCYDDQYFFDTDHTDGDSGAQSNLIDVDISALPASVHGGVVTNPSVEEFSLAVLEAIKQIVSFVDDQGEPMNESASQFLVMTPVSLMSQARLALVQDLIGYGASNVLKSSSDFNIEVVSNARLSSWTDSFAVFRTDGDTKPLIRQEEETVQFDAIGEGSETEIMTGKNYYCVSASRNVGYGYWQHAVKVTMT